jgi:hypothetical protein
MPLPQQLLLVFGAIAILGIVIYAVRKKRILIEDSLFWVAFAVLLVILGVFPQIAFFFAGLFGFQSAANFVFTAIMAVLLIKEFRNTAKISLLKDRVIQLSQEIGLRDAEREDIDS